MPHMGKVEAVRRFVREADLDQTSFADDVVKQVAEFLRSFTKEPTDPPKPKKSAVKKTTKRSK